jgi:hypothetical protein
MRPSLPGPKLARVTERQHAIGLLSEDPCKAGPETDTRLG